VIGRVVSPLAGFGRYGTPRALKFSAQMNSTPTGANRQEMHQHEDPKKRPLLTPAQLQNMRHVPEKPKKGTPREEFEKLFRLPLSCPQP